LRGCGWRARTNPANIPPSWCRSKLAAIAGSAQTLEGIAKAGVLLAKQFTQRGAVIVLSGHRTCERHAAGRGRIDGGG